MNWDTLLDCGTISTMGRTSCPMAQSKAGYPSSAPGIWPYTPFSILIVQRRQRRRRESCQRARFFRRVRIRQVQPAFLSGLKLSDPDGLQQASLFLTTPETHFSAGSPELKTGRLLGGATNAIVDFEYDGIIPSDREHTNLATLLTHRMEFEVVDMLGNIGKIGLSLLHNSTHKLVISLDKEKRNGAYGVAFSPDGKVLASGSENQTVELWNAETGEHIATLSGYEGRGYFRRVFSVAFSPDGSILATGTWEGTIKLWDVATRTEIITFEHGGREGRIMSLAFSPDGKILASALTDDWTSGGTHSQAMGHGNKNRDCHSERA